VIDKLVPLFLLTAHLQYASLVDDGVRALSHAIVWQQFQSPFDMFQCEIAICFPVALTAAEGVDTAPEALGVTIVMRSVIDQRLDTVQGRERFRVAGAILQIPGIQHQ